MLSIGGFSKNSDIYNGARFLRDKPAIRESILPEEFSPSERRFEQPKHVVHEIPSFAQSTVSHSLSTVFASVYHRLDQPLVLAETSDSWEGIACDKSVNVYTRNNSSS